MSALSVYLFIVLGEGPSCRKEMATQKMRRQGGLGGLWAASISARKKAVSGMLPPSHHAACAAQACRGCLAGSRPAAQPTAREPQQSRANVMHD